MTPIALLLWTWRAGLAPEIRARFDAFIAAASAPYGRGAASGDYVLTRVEHAARLSAPFAKALNAIVVAARELPRPPGSPEGPVPVPYPNVAAQRTETVSKDEVIQVLARLPALLRGV